MPLFEQFLPPPAAAPWHDRAVAAFLQSAVEFKAFSLFAFLFGFGMILAIFAGQALVARAAVAHADIRQAPRLDGKPESRRPSRKPNESRAWAQNSVRSAQDRGSAPPRYALA